MNKQRIECNAQLTAELADQRAYYKQQTIEKDIQQETHVHHVMLSKRQIHAKNIKFKD